MHRIYLLIATALVVLVAPSQVMAGKAYIYEDGTSFVYEDFLAADRRSDDQEQRQYWQYDRRKAEEHQLPLERLGAPHCGAPSR